MADTHDLIAPLERAVWWLIQALQQTCSRLPGSARCVQSFDDSLDSAIRTTYRISLRSSSLWEPRHPLLKVFEHFFMITCPLSPQRERDSKPHISCARHFFCRKPKNGFKWDEKSLPAAHQRAALAKQRSNKLPHPVVAEGGSPDHEERRVHR
jgi:hypothetical protein